MMLVLGNIGADAGFGSLTLSSAVVTAVLLIISIQSLPGADESASVCKHLTL